MTGSSAATQSAEFDHSAFLYRDSAQYVSAVVGFVRTAIKEDEPVFVAVPEPRLDALRQVLGQDLPQASCADMRELGRNPGRILAALLSFAERHAGRAIRVVQEPMWAERSAAELLEATRHEALTNTAFADSPVTFLCPYDAGALPSAVLTQAGRTHARLVVDGEISVSGAYTDPLSVCADCDLPLPEPPAATPALVFTAGQTANARQFTENWARNTPLSAARRGDLVLAVGEAIANSIAHGGGRGTLRAVELGEPGCRRRGPGQRKTREPAGRTVSPPSRVGQRRPRPVDDPSAVRPGGNPCGRERAHATAARGNWLTAETGSSPAGPSTGAG